jgi:arylsulfatase A-like enzyme
MAKEAKDRRFRLGAGVLLAAALIGCCGAPAASASEKPPNIVFVLTDDLSWDLVRHMPNVRRLQREGMTFRQFLVSDSLCCSSRATILTGEFPHNTHVLGNTWPVGGYGAFRRGGARKRSVGISLQRAGYRTALLGKYLNGYRTDRGGPDPGWNEWLASSNGYHGFGYHQSDNGHPMIAGFRPRDYVTDVLSRRAVHFIRRSAHDRQPFFALVSTYAPHKPYSAAPRHRSMFRHLPLPVGGAFNAQTSRPSRWLGRRRPLTAWQRSRMVRAYRARVRSVQAVDEMVRRLRATLRAAKVARNTFFVFSSDNGYHLGQHRLTEGKRTAFDHDIRVPLIIAGRGVPRGSQSYALSGTVDLAPTFERWAGVPRDAARDGRPLTPLLRRARTPRHWRRALLIEHSDAGVAAGDPDAQLWRQGRPPSYAALRTRRMTYVEYENGDREFYDRRRDPFELRNRARSLSRATLARLSAALRAYRRCAGASACQATGAI